MPADRVVEFNGRPVLSALLLVLAGGCGTVVEPEIPPDWGDAEAVAPLSHEACVRLALGSAPSAAAWQAKHLAAAAALAEAQAFPDPTLGVEWEDFGLGLGAAGPMQRTWPLTVALNEILSHGRKVEAAGHEFESAMAKLRVERQDTAGEVHRAYDRLVAARARVALKAELEAEANRERIATERFVAAGAAARIELDRAGAEVMKAGADRTLAEAEARSQALAFAFSLGFRRPVPVTLADSLTPPPEISVSDESLLAAAAAARPEIAEAEARYAAELVRLRLEVSRIRFLPTVSFGPRRGAGPTRGVATLQVELPFPDTGEAAEDSRRAELLAAAAGVRAAARKVAAEVLTARDRLAATTAFLADHARPLAARRRALREETRRLFEAGAAEFTAVIVAARDEVEARLAALDAESAVAEAAVSLHAALGAYAGSE